MTADEFRRIRHALGLSVAGAAAALSDGTDCGSQRVNPRTIRRWEAGDRPIPGPAAVAMRLRLAEARRPVDVPRETIQKKPAPAGA